MKKLAFVALAIVAVAAVGLAVLMATYRPAQRPVSAVAAGLAPATPAEVMRGAYLARHVTDCFGCHSQHDWKRWAGPEVGPEGAGGGCMGADYGVPGQLCIPNITSDREHGVGAWTDAELLRAIREGVDRDGEALFPMMPYVEYRNLSDEDARAIVAFLRTLRPIPNDVPETSLEFPVSFFIKMVPKPLDGPVAAPPDQLGRGRYLATVAGCRFCHTPVDDHEQPLPGKDFAGGHDLIGYWGKTRSANLTPDPTGLGSRTREQFIGQFRAYANPSAGASPMSPVPAGRNTPMPWLALAGMSDEDLGAIYDYLRTVPPVANSVDRFPTGDGKAGR
jgi:hypothetical protein